MKPPKRKRDLNARLPILSQAHTRNVHAAADDDDLADVLAVPAFEAGSNAYELLLGGLEKYGNARSIVKPTVKVKTRTPSTAGASVPQPTSSASAEQPLHTSNDASSSDDGDDRSGGAAEEGAHVSATAAQGRADYFSQQFDTASSDAQTVAGKTGQVPSAWAEASSSLARWPETSWHTTGQPLPQVVGPPSQLLCGAKLQYFVLVCKSAQTRLSCNLSERPLSYCCMAPCQAVEMPTSVGRLHLAHAHEKAVHMQAHPQLKDYGIKGRLQSLWHDAHSTQSQSRQHMPRSKQPKKAPEAVAAASGGASQDALAASHMKNLPDQPADFVDARQAAVFAVCNSYMDLFLANHPYPVRYVWLSPHTVTSMLQTAVYAKASGMSFAACNRPCKHVSSAFSNLTSANIIQQKRSYVKADARQSVASVSYPETKL